MFHFDRVVPHDIVVAKSRRPGPFVANRPRRTGTTRMRLHVGASTNRGRIRSVNEDAYGLLAEEGLFVVCDGMGGALAGEVASRIAVDVILERLTRSDMEPAAFQSADDQGYLARTSQLAEAVRQSNQLIYNQARSDGEHTGMGTTVVGAWIKDSVASIAHIGDSRAYLWHNHHLEPLTSDHSLVEAHVRAGLLDRDMSLQSDHQNILLRALGREPEVEVDLKEVPLQPGDYLLLCSDGLTRMVPELMLAQTIVRWREPQRICDALIDAANRNGGADNITAVVVAVAGTWCRSLWNRLRWKTRGGHGAAANPAV